MCDDVTERDTQAWLQAKADMTRREFSAAAGGTVLTLPVALSLPIVLSAPANAVETVEAEVTVTTPDGEADAFFVHPAEGKAPGFLMWPDIMGLRPAFKDMARRLAQSGNAVLVVNPYYRTAKGRVLEEGESFADPDVRQKLISLARSLSIETTDTDTKAFGDFLDASGKVDGAAPMGVCGYCMGGPMAFRSAVARPERFQRVASFHGGGLVTEAETSPHKLVGQTKADYLVAIAENDDEKDPEAKGALIAAFADAGLKAEVEVYEGTLHGWCPPDSRVYNEAAAEKAWSRLLALLGQSED